MANILVVDSDPELAAALGPALGEQADVHVLETASLKTAADMCSAGRADILLVGPAIASDLALEVAERLRRDGVALDVILIAPRLTTELLRTAMKAGVRDVVSTEDGLPEVVRAVKESVSHVGERDAIAGPKAEEDDADEGLVITVFSTKGGVGKTVIATNLAVTLARLGHRVALLDLDLPFGDVGIMLQAPPERTIFDVVQNFDRLDADMLRGFLTAHDSGVQALLAPAQPEQAEYVTSARIGQIITMLRPMFDYIVVDTAAALNDVVLTSLDKSDLIYAIATMDVASIKNTRIALQKLEQLGYNHGTVRLVLNRADSKVLLQPSDVQKAVERDIVAQVPSDRLVPRCVNKGVPIAIEAPRSAVARSILELAQQIAATRTEAPQNVA